MATYAGDTSSSAKTNYARLGHASQSLIPKLLQQLLLFYEPTNTILNDCLHNSYLKNKLNPSEWINIRKANTDGYVDFDISLIYKLLRNLKLIPKPTRGWDPKRGPMITETTIGDDLERFRKSRNDILHRGNTNVSDQELTEYFTQFKDIAQRLELALNKKKNELVSEFQNLETCCMDGISEQILANLAKKEKEFTLPNEISEYLMSLISNAKSTDSRSNNPQTSNYSIKPSTPGTPVSTRVHTIASLTHKQNRWRIRARVTYKSDITEWSNHHSKGTCFSVHLSDESGEIRATGFHDAVDKYYKMLEVNKIYFISKGTLKTANKKFNYLNKYEITLKADTTVELCNEDVDDSKTPGNTVERAASTALLDDNAPPSKIRRMTQEDQRFGISTSSPLQGTSHEKNPEEASVSKVESEKRPQKKKIKKVNKDEKMLILTSYISLKIKSDWDKLTDNVYKKRKLALSKEMTKHYQDLYKQNKLKNRIKGYMQRVQSGRAKETDPEIIALI